MHSFQHHNILGFSQLRRYQILFLWWPQNWNFTHSIHGSCCTLPICQILCPVSMLLISPTCKSSNLHPLLSDKKWKISLSAQQCFSVGVCCRWLEILWDLCHQKCNVLTATSRYPKKTTHKRWVWLMFPFFFFFSQILEGCITWRTNDYISFWTIQ